MVGNIIPYIGGEEEKSEKEPLRLWGKVEDGKIVPATDTVITCQCVRVPVLDGHTAAVFVKLPWRTTGIRPSKCTKAVYPVFRRR